MSAPPVTRFLLVFFAAWSARAVLLQWVDEAIADPLLRRAWQDAWRVVLWGWLPWMWMRRVDGVRDVWTWCRMRGPVQLAPALANLGAGLLWLAGARVVSWGQGRGWVTPDGDPPSDASAWLATAIGLVTVPVLEELVFRGYLLRRLEAGPARPWAVWLQALAFGAAHLPGWWQAHGADHALILPNLLYVVLFGAVLGVIVRRGGTLWTAVLLHSLNNLLADWPFA